MHFVRGNHGIFIPRTRELIAPPQRLGFAGYITAELIDARTKKVKRRVSFKNLITNAGMNGIVTVGVASDNPALSKFCGVGTGTTAPANTDTTLVAEISTRATTAGNAVAAYVAGPPDYYSFTQTYTFTETQANGNLTEVGFFSASSAGTMWARQLFKDDVGTVTTITKTSSDQLKITYEIRIYPPTTDVVASAQDISGTSYTVTSRAIQVSSAVWNNAINSLDTFNAGATPIASYSGALPARTGGVPTGHLTDSSAGTATAYTTDSFVRNRTHIWEPANGGASITSVVLDNFNSAMFAIGFNPVVPKTTSKRFTLNTQFSWVRV